MSIAIQAPYDYIKFFDIATNAFKEKKNNIYKQLMTVLITTYLNILSEIKHENEIYAQNKHLEMNEKELDRYYDTMYDMGDAIKLLQKHLEPYTDKDTLFNDLYILAIKIHEALIDHIDTISTKEVKKIQEEYLHAN
jgi:DNA polymerase III delta prime subunit